MKRISLVCTVHEERGLANVSNLHAILEHLEPDIIFLEVPPEAYNYYYIACSQQNLESKAVIQYRQNRQVELVPIDLPTPDEDFFRNNRYLFERIEGNSADYRRLMDWYRNYVFDYGFAYLNCDDYGKHHSELNDQIITTIKKIDDKRITELYELWSNTNEHRDNEMMKKIYKYCRENTFKKAAFLIGAAHRQSITEKSRKQDELSLEKIQWNYYLQKQ